MAGGQVFTYTLTNASLVITEGMGFKKISIQCTSSTSGSVIGNLPAGGTEPTAIAISLGNSVTFENTAYAIQGLTITAPAGCTLLIIASQN